MIAGVLCHKLLYDGAAYLDAFQKSKYLLKKVSDDCFIKSVHDDSPDHWMLLYVICEYYDKHGVLPPKPSAVRDFAAVSEDLQISAQKDMIVGTLKEIKNLDEAALRSCTDPYVLVDRAIHEARTLLVVAACEAGVQTVHAGPTGVLFGKKDPSGIDDAKREIIRILSQDVTILDGKSPEGVWQENTEAIAERLDEYLSGKRIRVFTGMPQIDQRFVMRLGKTLVIAGNSGDGKSLLLNSMIYNMARDGERILYNALEFDTVDVWETLAFIHQRTLRDRYPLPPKTTWMEHDPTHNPTIVQRDMENMAALITDIRAGISVPGCIDVIRKWTLEEFMAYYDANDPKRHYSVVVIDYASHLKPEGNYRSESDKQAAIDNICSRLIGWTHRQNKFLFITPAQIGKTAAKETLKTWEKADADTRALRKCGYSLDSLYYGNALKQDGDLAISVFSPDDLKEKAQPEMIVKCHKYRLTKSFGTISLNVDPTCDYAYDPLDLRRYAVPQMADVIDEGLV